MDERLRQVVGDDYLERTRTPAGQAAGQYGVVSGQDVKRWPASDNESTCDATKLRHLIRVTHVEVAANAPTN